MARMKGRPAASSSRLGRFVSRPSGGEGAAPRRKPRARPGMKALREIRLDLHEGADIVMVKPAMSYLDVVAAAAAISPVPVAAYQVSGEYAMISAAAANGWVDRRAAVLESLTGIRRAGADIVLTYWAAEADGWLS